MVEPPHSDKKTGPVHEVLRFKLLGDAFRNPVLTWLFVLTVLMYGYSHLPFVFGQPYILEALDSVGLSGEAPLVSGAITAAMMLCSVATSLVAPHIRHALGLPITLCFAFAIQIILVGVLAATNTLVAMVFLLLRMVPNSLSQPFILARVQPLLEDESRATYLSIKSLVGRLLFAGSLWLASTFVSDVDTLAYEELQIVLGWYVVVGLICLAGLGIAALRIPLDHRDKTG